MVRVGEFAWSRMEPEEDHYDLDWLDRAIAAAAKHNIYTVIGTPTAAPPAWLTQKYPETLRVTEDGRRAEHGNRQQFNWANPKYREMARKIAEQMAKRFGHNPNVLGWQIDNEYSDVSFDPETRTQFQQWLKARYGTLDNSECALDHRVLERDVHRLGSDSDSGRLRQPRAPAQLDALRQRHLAQLSEEPAGRDSREFRSAPVHHHKHDGLVRRVRPLHRRAGSGYGRVG